MCFVEQTIHPNGSCFREKIPQHQPDQQADGVIWIVFEKKVRKDKIQYQEKAKRFEKHPYSPQPRTLVPHFQVGFSQHPDGVPVMQLFLIKQIFHK